MPRQGSHSPGRPQDRTDSGADNNVGQSERSAANSGCSAGVSHSDDDTPEHRDRCPDGYGTPEGNPIVDQDAHREPDEQQRWDHNSSRTREPRPAIDRSSRAWVRTSSIAIGGRPSATFRGTDSRFLVGLR